jgi:hypothetical protein
MRRDFDLTPLGHPAWWGALALLLINDNLFKGRGVIPAWLTGKLSDFAFLIVAPVLFAAIIPRRVPGRRTFAVAAVVALYVAADLSGAVSDVVVAAAARVGLHWRLWPDTTDLLALAVLPITVWLLRRPPATPAGVSAAVARRLGVQRERAGVVLGALACLATSSVPGNPHQPFLFNRTSAATDVRITWVLRKVDCSSTPEAVGAMLGPSDLDDPRTVTLTSGDVAALNGPPPAGMSPVGVCSVGAAGYTANGSYYSYGWNKNRCVAAILETPGATPVLMLTPPGWSVPDSGGFISCCDSSDPTTKCRPRLDTGQNAGDEAVSITGAAGALAFTLTQAGPHSNGPEVETPIQIAPIDPATIYARPEKANGCRETRDAFHAALDAASSCATDNDCRSVPALSLPGETETCAAYVNKNASTAALQSAEAQWSAMCQTNDDSCLMPLAAICKAGRCAEECAGVNLPPCPQNCSAYGSGNDICYSLYDGTCLDTTGQSCRCNQGKLICAPLPTVDPTCPIGCRPAGTVQPPTFALDAGAVDAAGDGGSQDGASIDAGAPIDAGAATDAGSAPDAGAANDGGSSDGS